MRVALSGGDYFKQKAAISGSAAKPAAVKEDAQFLRGLGWVLAMGETGVKVFKTERNKENLETIAIIGAWGGVVTEDHGR